MTKDQLREALDAKQREVWAARDRGAPLPEQQRLGWEQADLNNQLAALVNAERDEARSPAAKLADSGKVPTDRDYKDAYNRGWRAGNSNGALDRADGRGEPDAWYDGYFDLAAGRRKWHTANCPAHHNDEGGCGRA